VVLVASPAWLCARRSSEWPVCYELRGVSARDDGDDDRLPTMRGARRAPIAKRITRPIPKQNELLVIEDHTLSVWNLSGTF
jgi:hypothetical protein